MFHLNTYLRVKYPAFCLYHNFHYVYIYYVISYQIGECKVSWIKMSTPSFDPNASYFEYQRSVHVHSKKCAHKSRFVVFCCSMVQYIHHYSTVIMGAMASQITGVPIVYSTVCSGADHRKHLNSASLAFVRGIHRWLVNSPHKWPVTRKMFPSDDVIILSPFPHSCKHWNNHTIRLIMASLFPKYSK